MAFKGQLFVLFITLLFLQCQAKSSRKDEMEPLDEDKKRTTDHKTVEIEASKGGSIAHSIEEITDSDNDEKREARIGLWGRSAAPQQFGLWGKRQSRIGLWGKRQNGMGLWGRSAEPGQVGLWGKRQNGLGLWGRSAEPGQVGLWGKRQAGKIGLWGKRQSGLGLWGRSAEPGNSFGLWGKREHEKRSSEPKPQ